MTIRPKLRATLFVLLSWLAASQALAQVRITNMNDFAFGTWSGVGQLQSTDAICIYRLFNNNYRVTIRGSGAGNAFTVANGANTIAYGVEWAGSNGTFQVMTTGVIRSFTGTSLFNQTCNGGTNAQMRITMTAANLLAADALAYTGVVTVLIQP